MKRGNPARAKCVRLVRLIRLVRSSPPNVPARAVLQTPAVPFFLVAKATYSPLTLYMMRRTAPLSE